METEDIRVVWTQAQLKIDQKGWHANIPVVTMKSVFWILYSEKNIILKPAFVYWKYSVGNK